MNFFYLDNNNNKVSLDIQVGKKWSEQKVENEYLNTIFSKLDDGDDIVQEKEISALSKLLEKGKNYIKGNDNSLTLSNEDLKQLSEELSVKSEAKEIQSNPELYSKQANEFFNGNFDVLKQIDNPVHFVQNFKKVSSGNTVYSHLLNAFQKGEISKEQFIEYTKIIADKFEDFETNLGEDKRLLNFASSYYSVSDSISAIDEHEETLQTYYKQGTFKKEDILEAQQFIKDEFGKDLTEYAIVSFIEMFSESANLAEFDFETGTYHIDIEQFKQSCRTQKFVGDSFPKYVDNVINYSNNNSNISLESLRGKAERVENEYARYNYDLHNTEIGDLISKSEEMIKTENDNIKVVKNNGVILLKNSKTGEKRILDLNHVTSKLDNNSKQQILSCLDGMSNLVLWEMAVEATNSFECDATATSAGQYFIDNDHIGINFATTTYSLTHEMIHAMMATVIDGKNTFNELTYKNLLDTFKEEKREYKTKGIADSMDGYNYCGENIHEFAAEAGCLYLTGKSVSEFTIAQHFPKTYRIFVELIENIRSQNTGRSINS